MASDALELRLADALMHLGEHAERPDLTDRAAVLRWVQSLPPTLRCCVGGNTACVELRTDDDELIIIDLGSGARTLGNALMSSEFGRGEGNASIFLSHLHWDHIQGWPFFKPAYVPGNKFTLYARHYDAMEALRSQQQAPFFPSASWTEMRADLDSVLLEEEPLTLCEGRVKVTWHELNHPSKAWAYRFEAGGKAFVYASDGAYFGLTEEQRKPFVDFYRGADLLIFDAQFTLAESLAKRTWGHSSPVVGAELACEAGVKNLALFHHDPNAEDDVIERLLLTGQQYARTLQDEIPNIFVAREGDVIEL
jgi:phosphoribosyl 1,2-cyclic phosphodiesterase